MVAECVERVAAVVLLGLREVFVGVAEHWICSASSSDAKKSYGEKGFYVIAGGYPNCWAGEGRGRD